MKATIEATKLKSIINTILPVIDEVVVNYDEGGWSVLTNDRANVCILHLTIGEDEFEKYEVDEEGEFGFNVKKMNNILDMAGDENVNLDIGDSIKLEYGKYKYKLPTVDVDLIRRDVNIPDIEYDIDFDLDTDEFKDAIKASDKISNQVKITFGSDLSFESIEGQDEISIDFNDYEVKERNLDEPVESKYSIDYLSDMTSSIKSDMINISYSTEFPISLKYVGEGTDVLFMLAPMKGD